MNGVELCFAPFYVLYGTDRLKKELRSGPKQENALILHISIFPSHLRFRI